MSDAEIHSESTSFPGSSSSSSNTNINPPEIDYTKLPTKKQLKMKDLPEKSKPWGQVELPVDALWLTVKECEFLSCVSHLNQGYFKSYNVELGPIYFGKIGGEEGTMKIALQRCKMGPDDAIIAVKNAARVLRPKAVFSVGFCGGLKDNLKLGDVIISSKLRTYSSLKITESAIEDRNDAVPLNTHLSKLLLDANAGWNPPLKDEKVEVNVITNGVILSGPQVVDNKDRRAELTKRYGDATAIEMEGQGLYKAAHELNLEWVVIKGVADFADGKKSDTNAWRPFASAMAASLTAHILSNPTTFERLAHYSGAPEKISHHVGTQTEGAASSRQTSNAGTQTEESMCNALIEQSVISSSQRKDYPDDRASAEENKRRTTLASDQSPKRPKKDTSNIVTLKDYNVN